MNQPNEQLSDVIFVSRPLYGWGTFYSGSGQGIISQSKETYGYWIGHHAVIAITQSGKKYVLHNTSDLEFIIEPFSSFHQFSKSDYLSEYQKKVLPKISLQELYDSGLGDNKLYSILTNNCVHALNRMKVFINKKLKEMKEEELELTTNAGSCANFGIQVILASIKKFFFPYFSI